MIEVFDITTEAQREVRPLLGGIKQIAMEPLLLKKPSSSWSVYRTALDVYFEEESLKQEFFDSIYVTACQQDPQWGPLFETRLEMKPSLDVERARLLMIYQNLARDIFPYQIPPEDWGKPYHKLNPAGTYNFMGKIVEITDHPDPTERTFFFRGRFVRNRYPEPESVYGTSIVSGRELIGAGVSPEDIEALELNDVLEIAKSGAYSSSYIYPRIKPPRWAFLMK